MSDFAPNSWEAVVFEKFCRQEKIDTPRRSAAKSSKAAQDLFSDRFWKVQSADEAWYNQPKFVARFDAFMNKFYPASSFKFEVQRTMETLLVFIIEMSRARDKADRALACINLLQKHTRTALLTAERFNECVEKGSSLLNHIMDFYAMLFDKPEAPDGGRAEIQSADETFSFFHSILDSYDTVKEHPFVVKFQRFGMYALSLSLFSKLGLTFKNCGYSKVEEKFLKQKYTLGISFLHCLFDTLLFVTEKGYQCIQTGTWDPIIHCGNEYSKWFADVTKLRVQALYMSDPEALKELKARDPSVEVISQFEFLSKADELIEQGQAILKFAPKMKDVERSTMSVAMGQLQLLRANEVTKRAAQKMRQAPFSLLVSGGSSVGKSTLVDLIYYQIAKTLKLPSGSEYKYTRNFADGFWSGFHPGMWFVILDDVAFLNPNKAPNGDPSLLEVIQIVNRIPLVTNQAELADKGKCPCRAKCVIATTNSPDLNATKYFSCPLAVQRRFPFMIDVRPRARFVKDGQFMDSSKVQEWKEQRAPTEVFDDLWAIQLYKIQPEVRMQDGRDPRVGQQGKHIRINSQGHADDDFEFETIYDFLAWISRTMLAHQKNEDMMDNAGAEARDITICGSCFFPTVRCRCVVPHAQASDEDDVIDVDAILRETELEDDEMPIVDLDSTPELSVEQLAQDFPDDVENDTGIEFRAQPSPFREELSAEGAWFKACHNARTYFRNTVVDVETMADEFMYPFRNRPMGYRVIQSDDEFTRWERVKMWMMYPFFAAFMHCATLRYCTLWIIFTCRGDRLAKRCLQYTGFLRLFTRNIVWQTGERMARQFAGTDEVREYARQILKASGSIIAITMLVTYGLKIMGWVTGTTKSKKARKAAKASAQGATESLGQAPVPLPNERVNAWQQSSYQTTTFDVSPQTTSRAREDFQSFVNMIGKNCLSLCSTNYGVLGGRRRGKAICVTGHIYLTNNHVLPEAESFDLDLVSEGNTNPMTKNITIRMSQTQIHRYPEQDLALFEVLALPPRKDLRALFMQETLAGSANGTLLSLELDGTFTKRNFMGAALAECNVEKIPVKKFWVSLTDKPTEVGDCGSISLANTRRGPVLLGIHVAGEGKTIMSIPVTAQFLTTEVAKFTKFPIQSGTPMLAAPSAQRHLSPQLHGLSVVNWMQEGKIAGVYGSFLGHRNAKKSSVQPTVIAEACAKRGYETKFGAPDMSRVPWYNALHDLVDPVLKLDASLLELCAESYAADIIKAIPDQIKKTIHVLDMESTINGMPGVAYIDAMKRNTSAGCPWKKSKKYFFKPAAPRGNLQDPVDVDPEIMDRVEIMRENYKQGRRNMPVFNGCAKDEPLKFKKVEAKKTRIFTGSPVDFSILMRQYLLCTARLFQNNRFVCESAPGTNAHSKEWQEIREYLVQHGEDRMIAGDYAAFDKRMSPLVILMAMRVLIRLCEFSGNYTEEDLWVLHGIAEDIAFPLIDFSGDLIEILGSNPSGHILTVIINCIANCLYMRYVYAKLAKKAGASTDDRIMLRFFKKLIALITYGDDNAMGVSKRCPWFNHTDIQKELALVGITYTMADKEAESVPYIHIDEVSFLKRFWRWDADLEAYVCPLEEGSIEKTLMVCVASDTITLEEQAVESLQACCTEYFWFGKEVFEEKRRMMIEVARESGLADLLAAKPLPTWQKLADRYHGRENADEPTLVGKIVRGLLQ